MAEAGCPMPGLILPSHEIDMAQACGEATRQALPLERVVVTSWKDLAKNSGPTICW